MNENRPGVSPSERARRENLDEALVKENLITRAQLEDARKMQREQGGRLSDILINQGMVKAEDLATWCTVSSSTCRSST